MFMVGNRILVTLIFAYRPPAAADNFPSRFDGDAPPASSPAAAALPRLPNRSGKVRAMIYATVCRPFFIDYENFRKGNSKVVASRASLERLEKRDRKRLSRAELID